MQVHVQLKDLHSKQQEIFDNPARFKVVCAGRRGGKSALCYQEIILTMLNTSKPKHTMYMALERESCYFFYLEILSYVPKELIESSNLSLLKLTLINGSTLTMFSAESVEKIRGKEFHLAVIDEASKLDLKYIWNEVVRATLLTTLGRAYIISTPFGQNYFFQIHKQATNGELGVNWMGYHFTSYDNPFNSAEELEDIRRSIDSATFEQEYMANARANVSNPFKYEDIIKNIIPTLSTDKIVSYGVDISNGQTDSTVVIGITKDGVMGFYDSWKIQNNYTEQTNKINALPKGTLKVVDSTGSGVAVSEALENKGHYVYPYLFTAKSKPALIFKFIQAVESGLVKYTSEVAEELHVYEMKFAESGNTKFGNQSGFNDDRVTALALAYFGLTEFISVGSNWKGFSTC